jgi:hypothetical protein
MDIILPRSPCVSSVVPSCGSGTSGVASKELACFFVGAEKEEEYEPEFCCGLLLGEHCGHLVEALLHACTG